MKIAIVAPAGAVKEEYVEGAVRAIEARGHPAVPSPHCTGRYGSYSAGESERLSDLLSALEDPDIDAILCARGGYGCVHLLPHIPAGAVRRAAKPVIGFSDVSALHALWHAAGVPSVHGGMARFLTETDPGAPQASLWWQLIEQPHEPVHITAMGGEVLHEGRASGVAAGGNLAVLTGLAGTPFDLLAAPLREQSVLFIEDIGEEIYAVERMLWRLHLSGILRSARAVIAGRFTDYGPDRNWPDMESMLRARLGEWVPPEVPCVIGFPTGHIGSGNVPLPVSREVEVEFQKITL